MLLPVVYSSFYQTVLPWSGFFWNNLSWFLLSFRFTFLGHRWVDSWLRSLQSIHTSLPECIRWYCVIHLVILPSSTRHGPQTGTIPDSASDFAPTAYVCVLVSIQQLLADASFHVEEDCSTELCQRTSGLKNGRCNWLHGWQSKWIVKLQYLRWWCTFMLKKTI